MIGGHLSCEGTYSPVSSFYPHNMLSVTHKVSDYALFRPFLGPHQHRLLQPEPVHVIALLAVRLHGDHEAAASRIDTQPNPLLQLRGVGNAARHQPLTGNGENLVARL